MSNVIDDDTQIMGYADDHSIYKCHGFRARNFQQEVDTVESLEKNLASINNWMNQNRLNSFYLEVISKFLGARHLHSM